MTQAELEKEARKWASKNSPIDYSPDVRIALESAYLAGAAPREKKLEAVRNLLPWTESAFGTQVVSYRDLLAILSAQEPSDDKEAR